MHGIVGNEELGRRIRKLRMDQRLTLKQVEVASSLSATHLSEIERGRTSPTVGALVRIAAALGRAPSYFLEPEELVDVGHLAEGHGTVIALASGVSARAVSPGIPGAGVFAYQLRFEGGSWSLPPDAGEAMMLVRAGALEARLGGTLLALGPGDAAQSSAGLERHLRATSEPAEVLLVLARPLAGPR
jgi:hypothetical protein